MSAQLQSRKQILVTGCYRTGTEFITQLIGSHPDIEATMYVVNYLRYCLDEYGDIGARENLLSLLFDAAQRIRERWDLHLQVQTVADACEKQDELTNGFLYDAMMADLFLDGQQDIWLEKNQLVWTKIPQFLDMFPNGQVIHVHRDPRSVLASFREFTYTPAPAYLSAVFNILDSMRRSKSYRAEYPPERYTTVRYEDIAQQPQKQLEEVFNFLNLPTQKELKSFEAWEEPDGSSWNSNSAFGEEDPGQFDTEAAITDGKNT